MSRSAHSARRALENLHANIAADVQLLSPEAGWELIAASRFRLSQLRIDVPPLGVPAFAVNYGPFVNLRDRTCQSHPVRFKPGNLAVIPADHLTRWEADRICDVVAVSLSETALEHAALETSRRDPRALEITPSFAIRDMVLERIAHQLLREIIRPEPGTRLRVQARAGELALHLVRAHSNMGRCLDRQVRTIPPHKLKRVKDYICSHLARDLTLVEVAAVADMTMFHFAKAFRYATGSAPHRYVTEHRILHGRTLLHDRTISIRTVARAVGFTHSHFTRLFTRHMGMTPSVFRELL